MAELVAWAEAGDRMRAANHLAWLQSACLAVACLGEKGAKEAKKLEEALIERANGERR